MKGKGVIMKKILVLASIALSCAFAIVGLSLNNTKKVNALEEQYTINISSNYRADNLFKIEIDTGSPSGAEIISELPFEKSYEDITSVKVYISKQSIPDNYVEFLNAFNGATEITFVDNAEEFYLEVPIDLGVNEIKINFELRKLELKASYKQEPNNDIGANPTGSIINYYKANGTGGKEQITADNNGKFFINYGDTLIMEPVKRVKFSNNKSYTFKNLYFNFVDLGNLVTEDAYIIDARIDKDDERFLDKYIAYEPTIIYLVATYTNDYSLKLDFNEKNYKVDYEVFVNNENVLTKTSAGEFFTNDTKLEITMQLLDYTKLNHISGMSLADNVDVKDGKVTITFAMTRDKEFIVYLDLVSYEATNTGSSGANINFKKNTFAYNEKVEITATVENSLNEIKTWKINGIEVPKVGETANGISRTDVDKVEIDTAVWYEKFGLDFNNFKSEVATGMKTNILLAITLPIGFAVLAVLVLMLIILQNMKTKKKIRALLESEKQMELKFGSVSMADQLREGKTFTVTDEEVKAEMKKRKTKETKENIESDDE